MNVSIAFNSMFNAEDSRRYIGGSNTLLEITQKTSLLLHNLLDVAEEFHLAQMNIPNLVQGNFDSPSGDLFSSSHFSLGQTSLTVVANKCAI
jgi:hypothetical protein